MIEPQRMEDMAQSVVLMYQQGGWIDRWPQINLYTNDMVGSPLTIIAGNGMARRPARLRHGCGMGRHAQRCYAGAAARSGRYLGEKGIDWINKVHYVPDDKVDYGSVSRLRSMPSPMRRSTVSRWRSAKRATRKCSTIARSITATCSTPKIGSSARAMPTGRGCPTSIPRKMSHGFIEGSGWHYQSLAPADLVVAGKSSRPRSLQRANDRVFQLSSAGLVRAVLQPV